MDAQERAKQVYRKWTFSCGTEAEDVGAMRDAILAAVAEEREAWVRELRPPCVKDANKSCVCPQCGADLGGLVLCRESPPGS